MTAAETGSPAGSSAGSPAASSAADIVVERAGPDDAAQLAELHVRHFSADDHLAMAFGPDFVRAVYRWFVASPETFVLVARDAGSGALLGFTSVADRPYTVPMLRACLPAALRATVRRPTLLLHPEVRARVRGLLRERTRGRTRASRGAADEDLTDVGQVAFTLVVPEARGRGVGARLKAASVERARARGRRGLLTGIRADNEASQRMNLRAGFVELPERRSGAMRTYLLRFDPAPSSGSVAAGGASPAADPMEPDRKT